MNAMILFMLVSKSAITQMVHTSVLAKKDLNSQ